MSNITPIILCGGSGTRLWPLSRKSFPKQFVPLIGSKSLLQLTLERVSFLSKNVICVASDEHRFLVVEAMQAAKVQGTVLLEPVARNTAAAMAIAALAVKAEDLLLFCPSDHHIPDGEAFAHVVKQGVAAAQVGAIVTFGISPTFPSTAYGYIRQGNIRADGAFNVEGFAEKPAKDKAEALLLTGAALWNGGIFLCSAQTLLSALGQHAPDILQTCQQSMSASTTDGGFVRPDRQAFEACRSESIDYAVMERHTNVAVLPFVGAWSDVGSWNAVADLIQADTQGNRIYGQGFALQANSTYVHAPHRPVVVLGTQDLLVIDTPDALLVAASSHVEQVKQVVARLDAENISESVQHRKVARPWGAYDSVDVGERHQVKRITVRPGAKLSLQMHHHRAEHWIVVKGMGLELPWNVKANGTLRYRLSDNYERFTPGWSNMPQVRTHIAEYMTTSRVTLENLSISKTNRLGANWYGAAYAGYFENMFGGVGGEVLYREPGSRWAAGLDVNHVKQRNFAQDFGFRDYAINTGHLTGYWITPFEGVHTSLSVGQYLAGDRGATMSIQKVFANGSSISAYATKTNVPAAVFGEGSFDKGIAWMIPFDAFLTSSSRYSAGWSWKPLLRDGGAKVGRPVNLFADTVWLSPNVKAHAPAKPDNDSVAPDDRLEPYQRKR